MVVDSSAIFAIVLEEPEAAAFARVLQGGSAPKISAATLLEVAVVGLRRFARRYDARVDHLLAFIKPDVRPVTVQQSMIARAAYRRFGRGTGHPADLNFGDCFSYALAKELDEPLLFKGEDFIHTDIEPAAPR